MSIDSKVLELSKEILESQVFNDYKQYRSIVERNSEYKNMIKSLQQKQFDAQTFKSDNQKLQSAKSYFNEINKIPDINKYINAEKRFNETIANIYKTINSKIQSNL